MVVVAAGAVLSLQPLRSTSSWMPTRLSAHAATSGRAGCPVRSSSASSSRSERLDRGPRACCPEVVGSASIWVWAAPREGRRSALGGIVACLPPARQRRTLGLRRAQVRSADPDLFFGQLGVKNAGRGEEAILDGLPSRRQGGYSIRFTGPAFVGSDRGDDAALRGRQRRHGRIPSLRDLRAVGYYLLGQPGLGQPGQGQG